MISQAKLYQKIHKERLYSTTDNRGGVNPSSIIYDISTVRASYIAIASWVWLARETIDLIIMIVFTTRILQLFIVNARTEGNGRHTSRTTYHHEALF